MPYISGKYDENYYVNVFEHDRPGYLAQLGRVRPLPGYCFCDRMIARYFFDYIVSGSGYVELDGVKYEVRPGDLIYVKKGVKLSYSTNDDNPYEKYWLSMDGEAIDSLIGYYLGDQSLMIRHGCEAEPFLRLKSIIASSGYDESRVMCVLLELIMRAACLPVRETRGGELNEYARCEYAVEFKKYIEDHLNEHFSLDEAAEHFHISKRHLIRLFKEKYDQTPGAYHTDIRLTAAARYLTETDFSIGEIALSLGYSDQSFFSVMFKKKYGVYPTAYRREAKRTDIDTAQSSIASPSEKE